MVKLFWIPSSKLFSRSKIAETVAKKSNSIVLINLNKTMLENFFFYMGKDNSKHENCQSIFHLPNSYNALILSTKEVTPYIINDVISKQKFFV